MAVGVENCETPVRTEVGAQIEIPEFIPRFPAVLFHPSRIRSLQSILYRH